jgi:hypothetical protein
MGFSCLFTVDGDKCLYKMIVTLLQLEEAAKNFQGFKLDSNSLFITLFVGILCKNFWFLKFDEKSTAA